MKRKPLIPNNLSKYRVWKGITQKQLAIDLEVSLSMIRGTEKGEHYPRPHLRLRISEYFGVSLAQMFPYLPPKRKSVKDL